MVTPAEIAKQVDSLFRLATQQHVAPTQWLEALESAETPVIVGLLSQLGSTGTTGAQLEALRESARALLDARLSAENIQAMQSLEAAATRLSKVAIAVTVVLGVLGLATAIL